MEAQELSAIANIIIALSTTIGVAAASAFYMTQIRGFQTPTIIATITFYILLTILIVLASANHILKWQNKKEGTG